MCRPAWSHEDENSSPLEDSDSPDVWLPKWPRKWSRANAVRRDIAKVVLILKFKKSFSLRHSFPSKAASFRAEDDFRFQSTAVCRCWLDNIGPRRTVHSPTRHLNPDNFRPILTMPGWRKRLWALLALLASNRFHQGTSRSERLQNCSELKLKT